ncbi:MAG TPA: sugar transferase [Thermoanaerobaculia bacterium]|jgi:lipopolysaccharide/colanic/teichoic acid biosynthesis glycosyltransferase|nr:sugar transferase [Thermoanaerobaculia bacterium]
MLSLSSKGFVNATIVPAEPDGLPRGVDAVLALAGLVASSPVLLVASAFVAATSPGPVLFRQTRVGLGGRPFTLLKLRTMRIAPEGSQLTTSGDSRITPVGRWLRRFKLDELPQLWNVVRGDMSLVGPRPEVPRYVDASDPLWQSVLSARPGLTDPVTLRLRDEEALLAGADDVEGFYRERLLPWKLRGYRDYLARRSWTSDLGVLGATALAVLRLRRPAGPGRDEIEGVGR